MALIWAACCSGTVWGQISPGPLSRAHRALEGVTRCGSCHDFGAGTRGFQCLECHTEIRRRVESRAGFHARAYKASAMQTDCARCHMEHNGEGFALVRFDRKTFDHLAQTGVPLEGKHRQAACEACHNEKHIAAGPRAAIKVKDLNRTYLGLRRECANCHEDRHRGQLGANCSACHGQEAWTPAAGFNHSQTRFPLTGLHRNVACGKCHAAQPGQAAALFGGLRHDGCQSCHTDPHRGAFQAARFPGSCERCHTTAGWKNNRPGTIFNHAATRFPLAGRHAAAACPACHKSSDFEKPVPHQFCRDCHQDPHNGQFAARAGGSDCSACHSESGFRPSRFDRSAHMRGAFPLLGKHESLRCSQCHQPEGRGAVYVTGKLLCADCHADRHAGQFAAAPIANRCDVCHTPVGFEPASFDAARHAQTRFPLTGRHAAVACAACHRPLANGGQARQYRFPALACAACHTDPHRTRLACESCHTADEWPATRPFDHASTAFALNGAHREVKCGACHPTPPAAGPGLKSAPAFGGTSASCGSCHQSKDPHAGQFRSGGPARDCAACHTTERWANPVFNHETARFALDVAHRNVRCDGCHKPRLDAAGKPVRVYRGTPLECVRCH